MLSSVKVQMLTLCSELVSGAVYMNPTKSLTPLEGCFKEKRRLMFHSPVKLSVFSVAVIVTTVCKLFLELEYRCGNESFTAGILWYEMIVSSFTVFKSCK